MLTIDEALAGITSATYRRWIEHDTPGGNWARRASRNQQPLFTPSKYASSSTIRSRARSADTRRAHPCPHESSLSAASTRASSPQSNTTASDTARLTRTIKPRRAHSQQEHPAGLYCAHNTTRTAAGQGLEPWTPHGATAFETAAFPLCHPANATTIAHVPATVFACGGDEQHRQLTAHAQDHSLVAHNHWELTAFQQKLL